MCTVQNSIIAYLEGGVAIINRRRTAVVGHTIDRILCGDTAVVAVARTYHTSTST